MKTAGLTLILLVPTVGNLQAGECIDWTAATCATCVRDLVRHGKNLGSLDEMPHQQQEPPAELKGTPCEKQAGSWYCFPEVCLVGPALEAIVELDGKSTKAATLLGTLRPYRSCGKKNTKALEHMLNHYPQATPRFQMAARKVLGNLRTGGKRWGDYARPCREIVRDHLEGASGDLADALWVGLTRMSIWEKEPVLEKLRQQPRVKHYAESRFPLPDCLATYFDVERQGLLRLVGSGFLHRLRNAVFARHGRRFESPDLQAFFQGQTWYQPQKDFSRHKLTRGDRINIRLIRAEERRRQKSSGGPR